MSAGHGVRENTTGVVRKNLTSFVGQTLTYILQTKGIGGI